VLLAQATRIGNYHCFDYAMAMNKSHSLPCLDLCFCDSHNLFWPFLFLTEFLLGQVVSTDVG
jgi:hypothetical protein